jgi:hypothetical protein
MILGFSTQLNGKPTYFVDKILLGIDKHIGAHFTEIYSKAFKEKFGSKTPVNCNSKIHTIREDATNRWKPETKIHFFINCRQPNMFCFAPVLPVVSVQKIEIIWIELFGKKVAHVFIEKEFFGKVKFDSKMIVLGDLLQLAHNDGFETIEDFFAYFNTDFKGKLIHWTDLKY